MAHGHVAMKSISRGFLVACLLLFRLRSLDLCHCLASQSKHAGTSAIPPITTLTVPNASPSDTLLPYPTPLHQIHVCELLSDAESAACLQYSHEYAQQTNCWQAPDTDRHQTYSTCDFVVSKCEKLSNYLDEIGFHERILETMSTLYSIELEDLSYLDLFCAHYQGRETASSTSMDRLVEHRDGSLLSFTITLSPPDSFTGGGTVFECLRHVDVSSNAVLQPRGVVRPHRAGDAVLHCGKLLHGADVVQQGERTVMVGFVEVGPWSTRDGALHKACKQWGRLDVAVKRLERQNQKCGIHQKGWSLSTFWQAPSALHGYCPRLKIVERRADAFLQRETRLYAEDTLLRSILLPKAEYKTGDGYIIL